MGQKCYLCHFERSKWRLIIHKNHLRGHLYLDMMEPHISYAQPYQCGPYIFNINGNIVQNIGPALLQYFHIYFLILGSKQDIQRPLR